MVTHLRLIFVFILVNLYLGSTTVLGNDSFFKKHNPKSFLRVDPKKQSLVNLICKHGGVILPKSIERDLKIISAVCHTDEISIDLIGKELLIKNFTVKLPNSSDTREVDLRVGQFLLKWNSYLHPILEIEVEDVDILVEFVNLILTRNNWHELNSVGFPPKLYYSEEGSKSTASSAFVRFGNIEMSGEVRLRVKSKPLEKNLIEDIVIDLRQLHSLSRQIQVAAKKSEEVTGRRGCSTEELYEILSKYFGDQIKKFLKLTATDLALNALIRDKGESKTVNDVKRAWSGAVNAAMNYAQSVGDKAEGHIDESLKQFGLGKDELNSVKDAIFKSRMSPKTNEDGNNFDSFSVEEPRDDD